MHIQKHIFSISCALLLLLPAAASAATISLQAVPTHVGAGDVVRVDVLLDSAIPTNAFSGTLLYSKTLEPIAVSDGNSIVNLWVTHPTISSSNAAIPFAGITPGGFSGNTGMLFSVLFRAKASGAADISLRDIEVLRDDGAGSKEPVTTKQVVLSISSKSSGGYVEPADTTPPEPFTANLGTDPQLFGGRSYLAFTAVDKGSGIDQYSVAESRLPSFLFRFFPLVWKEVVSPYALADQNLTSTIYIKAVDRAGNERASVYPPQHLFTVYEEAVLLAILIGVVFLFWRGEWGRRFKKNL